jgi:hypothetical protein
MENKYNDSTINRPFGNRAIDGNVITADLNAYFVQLMEEEAWQKNDRNSITLFKSGHITITLIALHEQAELNFSHAQDIHIINLQIMEGCLALKGVEHINLYKGQMVIFHEHGEHTGIAKENTLCLLTVITK